MIFVIEKYKTLPNFLQYKIEIIRQTGRQCRTVMGSFLIFGTDRIVKSQISLPESRIETETTGVVHTFVEKRIYFIANCKALTFYDIPYKPRVNS